MNGRFVKRTGGGARKAEYVWGKVNGTIDFFIRQPSVSGTESKGRSASGSLL
ncbi:hypothetical protein HpSIM50_15650 [Helicobacter pylori]